MWLQEFGVEYVAMESTGVYWKPVGNILESHFQMVLANAQHIKAVPGRHTDTKDCQWIAELLQHGLAGSCHGEIPQIANHQPGNETAPQPPFRMRGGLLAIGSKG